MTDSLAPLRAGLLDMPEWRMAGLARLLALLHQLLCPKVKTPNNTWVGDGRSGYAGPNRKSWRTDSGKLLIKPLRQKNVIQPPTVYKCKTCIKYKGVEVGPFFLTALCLHS